ncbi:hypothetical protein POSPLADRAFT_1040806 [Postia placenta MAD-698-R-SB12]|uniref:Uncharacterized protein n=1 Tax=Postia placenta MAD-698-R-SB12 TaxID=670580 RepID=A0A1X6MU14_9APHY|nr:hypothetical protein POSPLADRAFT_1040806 [Postia placenta MAD-698-R-SB12]OSX59865.1 hypothetical protein POSPLADRAFT_1040806 [Postia placenta MAD-698-R-SB12]
MAPSRPVQSHYTVDEGKPQRPVAHDLTPETRGCILHVPWPQVARTTYRYGR